MIKYIFIYKYQTKIYFSVVDTKYNYIEGDLTIDNKWLKTFKKIINPRDISSETEIVYDKEIGQNNPLIQDLLKIKNFVGFKINKIPLERISSRIFIKNPAYKRTKKTDKIYDPLRVYNRVLKNEDCPWITQEIHIMLKNKSRKQRKISKLGRMGVYYLFVRRYLMNKGRKI